MRPHSPCCRWSRRLGVERLEPRRVLAGAGLTAQYFHNDDFTGLADTRVEPISHNWATTSPGAGIDADTFSVRWTGQVQPAYSQQYIFTTVSDEAVRVWVDGQLIIDDWAPHSTHIANGIITLQAGQLYDICVDYREGVGAARMELFWSSNSQVYQSVPSSRLYASPAGLLGNYSDSSGHTNRQIDAAIDFNWGTAAPPGLTTDHFQATWTGRLQANYSELYQFATTSDDGVRLWIGGELVIDNWTTHSVTQDIGAKWLEAGKWYDIKLEYFEETGAAQVNLKWSSDRQTGAGVFAAIPTANTQATQATPVQFTNPLGAGADPWVMQWNGMYYLTRSNGNSVWIDRATNLEEIHSSTPESESVRVWTAPTGTMYSGQIWAPELHQINGKWYIYVAASDGTNANHRMHVLERDAADPFGAFIYKGKIAPATDRWAIDGTIFEWQGAMYFVWSGWPGSTDGQQNLYIAQMDTPWSLSTNRVLLSSPQYSWEKNGLPINEGPEILIHDGELHIIYSASGYWTNQYSLGRLTHNGAGSLLSAATWTKASLPVFAATSQVTGPGHASFTKSPDGREDWIVYHAHANPTVFNEDRVIRIQPFTFNADGTPNFGQPVSPGALLAAPSRVAERPILVGDFQADGVVDQLDYDVWRATFGAMVFPGVGADGSGNGVVDMADYVLWRKRQGDVATAAVSGTIGFATMAVVADASVASFGSGTQDREINPHSSPVTVFAGLGLVPALPLLEVRAPLAARRVTVAVEHPENARLLAIDRSLLSWFGDRSVLRGTNVYDEPVRKPDVDSVDQSFAEDGLASSWKAEYSSLAMGRIPPL